MALQTRALRTQWRDESSRDMWWGWKNKGLVEKDHRVGSFVYKDTNILRKNASEDSVLKRSIQN